MATTLRTLRAYLEKAGIAMLSPTRDDAIVAVFTADHDRTTYRDPSGSTLVRMVIQLLDQGRFLFLSVPNAWDISESPHKPAVFETLVTIQGRFPVVRFDYYPDDGQLWPNIEIPIEDGRITARQLFRSISGLLQCLSKFDRAIYWAMTTGKASAADVTMEERWGEYGDKNAATEKDSSGPTMFSGGEPFHSGHGDGGQVSTNRDSGGGSRLPDPGSAAFDSAMAMRLRTVLAIAQHQGGLETVERLLGLTDGPLNEPSP